MRYKNYFLYYVIVGMFLLIALFPFYWLFVNSFKSFKELYSYNPTWWPKSFLSKHYKMVLFHRSFVISFTNSVIAGIGAAFITLIVSSLAAYSLGRLRFMGRSFVAILIFFVYLIPPAVLMIPLYQMLLNLHLLNTRIGLILAFTTRTIPVTTWMFITYFATLPRELEEAAMIDGCNRFGSFVRIMLPLSTPALAAMAIFSFIFCWQMYLYPLVYITSESKILLPIYLTTLMQGDVYKWGELMASAVLTVAPVIVLFVFIQKFIVTGLIMGATKY